MPANLRKLAGHRTPVWACPWRCFVLQASPELQLQVFPNQAVDTFCTLTDLIMLCRTPHTSMGLSLALFGSASLPLAFKRTCALPGPVPSQLILLTNSARLPT
jgi:hypothetical protein